MTPSGKVKKFELAAVAARRGTLSQRLCTRVLTAILKGTLGG